ncbi:MAG: hypothetical protein HY786_07920 [Deltaproteobacteria bacterium]|nr:hypothetical protein [Deltaproteobacteria bacterium]
MPEQSAFSASCCGGGSASSLILPKFSQSMVDASLSIEKYDGFWNKDGKYIQDPPGSDLRQYRLSLGYAHRLAANWQASVVAPYVWNDNRYSALSSRTEGVGDTSMSIFYEAFDSIMCVYKVEGIADLKPASYFGASLTIPTGISQYDDVNSSFDVTGRGFYRLDGIALFDKTVYPWNASLLLSYGTHFERPVNREYGNYVEPYDKRLGDRALGTVSFGYTQFLKENDTVTYTAAYSDLREGEGTIDGERDSTTGIRKKSVSGTIAYATAEKDWIIKGTWGHAIKQDGWGENFPATDTFTLGVSRVFN